MNAAPKRARIRCGYEALRVKSTLTFKPVGSAAASRSSAPSSSA